METPEQYTKIKHTPLPWFQSHCKNADGETYSTKVYDHQGVIAVLEWYPIALGEGVTGTRREANAEFIVTACNEYYALKEENERLKGTIGVECVKQLSELKKALAELLRFESSIRYATTNALNEPDNFNKALDKVIELLQPKKDESHDEPIKER